MINDGAGRLSDDIDSARFGTPTANAADGDGAVGRSVSPALFPLDHVRDCDCDGWMNTGCARAQGDESAGRRGEERRGESDGASGGDDQGRRAAGRARATDRSCPRSPPGHRLPLPSVARGQAACSRASAARPADTPPAPPSASPASPTPPARPSSGPPSPPPTAAASSSTPASPSPPPDPAPVHPPPSAPVPLQPLVPGSAPEHTPAMPLAPAHLLPLLRCPLCSPLRLLTAPLTLRCGHTVCAEHVRPCSSSSAATTVRCPLPTCTSAFTAPHPDAGAGVIPTASASALPAPARVDVTTNKLLTLVKRAQSSFPREPGSGARAPAYNDDDADSDSEPEPDPEQGDPTHGLYHDGGPPADVGASRTTTDHDRPDSLAPAQRPRARSRSPSPRPRKRRRRTRGGADAPPPDPSARFQKELMAEMSCQICFCLFLQPVTTPCQHVSVRRVPG